MSPPVPKLNPMTSKLVEEHSEGAVVGPVELLPTHPSSVPQQIPAPESFGVSKSVGPEPAKNSVAQAVTLLPIPAEKPDVVEAASPTAVSIDEERVDEAEVAARKRQDEIERQRADQLRKETEQDNAAEEQISGIRNAFWKMIEDPATSLELVEDRLDRLPKPDEHPRGVLKEFEELNDIINQCKKCIEELESQLRQVSPVFADTEEQQENLALEMGERKDFAKALLQPLWQERSAAKLALLKSGELIGTRVDKAKLLAAYARNQKPLQEPHVGHVKVKPNNLLLTPSQSRYRKLYLTSLFASMRNKNILRFKINLLRIGTGRRFLGVAHVFCKKLLGQTEGSEDPAQFPCIYSENGVASYQRPTVVMHSSGDSCPSLYATNILILGVDFTSNGHREATGSHRIAAALRTIRKGRKARDVPPPFLLVVVHESGKDESVFNDTLSYKYNKLEVELELSQFVRQGVLSGFDMMEFRTGDGQRPEKTVDETSSEFFKLLRTISLKEMKKLDKLHMGTVACRAGEVAVRTAKLAWLTVVDENEYSNRAPYVETITAINDAWTALKNKLALERTIWPQEHSTAQSTMWQVEQKMRQRLQLPLPSYLGVSTPAQYLSKVAHFVAQSDARAESRTHRIKEVKSYLQFVIELSHLMDPIVTHCLGDNYSTILELDKETAYPSTDHLRPLCTRVNDSARTPVSPAPVVDDSLHGRNRPVDQTVSEPPPKRTRQLEQERAAPNVDQPVTVNRELQFTPGVGRRNSGLRVFAAAADTPSKKNRKRSAGGTFVHSPTSRSPQRRRRSLPTETERILAGLRHPLVTVEVLDKLIEIEVEHGRLIERTIGRIQACIDAANSAKV